ncbi:MAG: hypothetical protein V4631_17205 [Pseudomonadota bacterium]
MSASRKGYLGLTLCGIATSVLAALANVGLDNLTDLNVFALTVWYVLPAGAMCVGLIGASGFYAGALVLRRSPSSALMAHMVALAAFTQILIYFLGYLSAYDDGSGEARSFFQFLDASLTSTHSRDFGLRAQEEESELGGFAYPLAVIQFLGLLSASITVYCLLRMKQYCETCSLYLQLLHRVETFFDDAGHALCHFQAISASAVGSPEFIGLLGSETPGRGAHRVETLLLGCPGCNRQFVENKVWADKGGNVDQDNVHYHGAPVADGADLRPLFNRA